MFDKSYNDAAPSYEKMVLVFILATMILKIEVFVSYEKMHMYQKRTTFHSTSVRQKSLVDDRRRQ